VANSGAEITLEPDVPLVESSLTIVGSSRSVSKKLRGKDSKSSLREKRKTTAGDEEKFETLRKNDPKLDNSAHAKIQNTVLVQRILRTDSSLILPGTLS